MTNLCSKIISCKSGRLTNSDKNKMLPDFIELYYTIQTNNFQDLARSRPTGISNMKASFNSNPFLKGTEKASPLSKSLNETGFVKGTMARPVFYSKPNSEVLFYNPTHDTSTLAHEIHFSLCLIKTKRHEEFILY